jgi:hypothetical protein
MLKRRFRAPHAAAQMLTLNANVAMHVLLLLMLIVADDA